MTIAFNDQKIEKQLTSYEELLKVFGLKAKKIAQRLAEIKDAPNLMVLQKLPALKCRQLTGNTRGKWAIHVLPNFYLIFLLNHNPLPINTEGSLNVEQVTAVNIVGFLKLAR